MSEDFQISIPPTFVALYVPPGKIKPTLDQRSMAARYELCEDLAQMLTEQAGNWLHASGTGEEEVLARCLQALSAPPSAVEDFEARWVICRLAELLHWPRPAGL